MDKSHRFLLYLLPILAVSFLFSALSCRKNPVVPPSPKDPRAYTWTVDTLEYPGSLQTTMYDIWGSSPTDVYVVGFTGDGGGEMWHFDGKNWSPVNLPFGMCNLSKILGFAPNNIYAVGDIYYQLGFDSLQHGIYSDSSFIIHFDGTQWSNVDLSPRGGPLIGLWASSPTDVWTGGVGTLYHFDGTRWSKLNYPSDFSIRSVTGFSPQDVYFLSYNYPPSAYMKWFIEHYDGKVMTRLDSTTGVPEKFGTNDILAVQPDVLYSVDLGVFKYDRQNWNKVFDNGSLIYGIEAFSTDNVFAVGPGIILQFNGRDWYRYNQFTDPNIQYTKAWTNGEEVFIEGPTLTYPTKTIILHGK